MGGGASGTTGLLVGLRGEAMRKPQVQGVGLGRPAGAGAGPRVAAGPEAELQVSSGQRVRGRGRRECRLLRCPGGGLGGSKSFCLSEDSGGFEGCRWAGRARLACLCLY